MIKSFYLGLAKSGDSQTDDSRGRQRLLSTGALVRIFISVAILAVLIAWLSTADLIAAIASVPTSVWILVLALFVAGHVVSAFKWRLMMRATGVDVRPALSIRAHFAGLFANLCLPSIVGGDVIRAALVMREQKGEAAAIALASLADRLNDVLALIVISTAAALLMGAGQDQLRGDFLAGLAIILLACGIAGVLFIQRVPSSVLPALLHGIVENLRLALNSLFRNPMIAVTCLVGSLLIQAGFVGLNVIIANAMAIEATLLVWMFAWPMAKLIALAPVSFGGIGVREVALAGILAPFGVEASLAVAQSLSWEIVLIITGLVSGFAVAMLSVRNKS